MTSTGAAGEGEGKVKAKAKEKAKETAKPETAADNSDRIRLELKSVSCYGNGECSAAELVLSSRRGN
jgi:hypothetical protein